MIQRLAVGCLCLGACGGSFSTTGVPESMTKQVAAGATSHGGTAAAKAACSELTATFASNGSPRPVPHATATAAVLMGAPTQAHRIAGALHVIAGDCSQHSEEQMSAELKRLGREVGCDAILPPSLDARPAPGGGQHERHLQAGCVIYRPIN